MTNMENLLRKENVAIVLHQPLLPVEGENSIIFPPSYAEIEYNIVELGEGKNVCTIDSVGSQANRMEPLFKEAPYSSLIPRFVVKITNKDKTEQVIDVLDAGHRIADAVVRFSDFSDQISAAFQLAKTGNVSELIKMSPTSLVFGCWDSRDSGVKLPRIVRSNITAKNVHKLFRSATYFIPADYEAAGALSSKEIEAAESASASKPAKASVAGLANALSNKTHGGIQLSDDSELFREAVLSLSALRRLKGSTDEETKLIQLYILCLSLLAVTASQDSLLRMGCELTGDYNNPAKWELVKQNGQRETFEFDHNEILSITSDLYSKLNLEEALTAEFDPKKAKEALSKKE